MRSTALALAAAAASASLARGAAQDTQDTESETAAPVDPAEFVAPRRLSGDVNHRDYHPSCRRVGVRINGEEVDDCTFYDIDRRVAHRLRHPNVTDADIEAYIRDTTPESRQERRARQRWEQKHGERKKSR